MAKTDHKHPCQNCGHKDLHGEVSGCIALVSPQGARAAWCDCEAYVTPPSAKAAKVARTIPSRTSDPGTSHAAEVSVRITGDNQRGLLLKAFRDRAADAAEAEDDDRGLTDEEAANRAVGVSLWSEYAKRCSELRDAGLIVQTGETRKGDAGRPRIVSAITDQGQAVLASLR
jgi:hypothetical protein